ncbi:MAG TPA: O-antigen ligase family protein, partial [Sphingorhabdus sp.]|nr:O-antigen ligase family protein [Sphingorhabdus sp.]
LLGLMQAIGEPGSSLYLYRITNNGSAVGFFANRNHAAVLLGCAFPMLAVFASSADGARGQHRFRHLLAAATAIVLIPLILVTGSRSGMISALLGIFAAFLLYRQPRGRREDRSSHARGLTVARISVVLGALGLAAVTYFFSRAEAVERLFAENLGAVGRTDFLIASVDLFWKYFPWGSGSGSFVEAFLIIEPTSSLDSTYLNRAHNDWAETAVTFGVLGLIILGASVFAFVRRTYRLWRAPNVNSREIILGRLASATIAIIAIASFSDYPLRTPFMLGLFAVFILWFVGSGRELGRSLHAVNTTDNNRAHAFRPSV